MMNENLVDNPEIVKLKITIAAFKKYDSERKEYVSKLETKIGQLESYIDELEADKDIQGLRRKIKNQSEQLRILNQKIHFAQLEQNRLVELEYVTKDQLSSEIKKLKGDLLRERNSNDKLWSIIAKYRNKYGEI